MISPSARSATFPLTAVWPIRSAMVVMFGSSCGATVRALAFSTNSAGLTPVPGGGGSGSGRGRRGVFALRPRRAEPGGLGLLGRCRAGEAARSPSSPVRLRSGCGSCRSIARPARPNAAARSPAQVSPASSRRRPAPPPCRGWSAACRAVSSSLETAVSALSSIDGRHGASARRRLAEPGGRERAGVLAGPLRSGDDELGELLGRRRLLALDPLPQRGYGRAPARPRAPRSLSAEPRVAP